MPRVTLEARVEAARRGSGVTYFVSGSEEALGGWDVARAVELTPAEDGDAGYGELFRVDVAVAAGATVEYKLLSRRPGDAAPEWEEGPNRSFAVAADAGDGFRASTTWVDWASHDDGTAVVAGDAHLATQAGALKWRFEKYREALARIESDCGGLDAFSRSYERMGFNRAPAAAGRGAGIVFREWAPGARSLSLVGDFNGWNAESHVATKDDFGVFSLFLPDSEDGTPAIPHNSFVKVSLVVDSTGERVMRVPAWIRHAVLDRAAATYCGVYWNPSDEETYTFKHARPGGVVHASSSGAVVAAGGAGAAGSKDGAEGKPPARNYDGLTIYEAHVGMASEEGKIASYKEFTRDVLPRVKALGYNCVQLMAIQEHAYYASFGYHVTNFFAASSRFGSPEDLKELVDVAHGMGLLVIMDCVHSHASKNVEDGLGMFDGTDHQYFHGGSKGHHELWDSRIFDYGKVEVQRFLLSNLRWYISEFRFDGFRFDGVTSMLYVHHGIGTGFSGGYHEYFGESVDINAVVYLMLANHLLHSPELLGTACVTIAEDVSGMPTLGCPVADGGVGFDYRLAMAQPDMWIKLLKEVKDDDWEMGHIVHQLTNRRHQEKAIAYAESHDQALVGDKTLAFRLMDKEMYTHMTILVPPTPIIDRGIALHKLIRSITIAIGGEGYLNFMGNEFGHPEWIDFPREGNGESFHHCRRQWHLAEDPLLRYPHLNRWDQSMQTLTSWAGVLLATDEFVSLKHEGDKVIVIEKAGLLLLFNWHPTKSFSDYTVGVPCLEKYSLVLSSDDPVFGGHARVNPETEYFARDEAHNGRPAALSVYMPSRTCIVLAPESLLTTSPPPQIVPNIAERE